MEVDLATRVQILDEAVFFSHGDNLLVKGMHPTTPPPTSLEELVGQPDFFNFGMATSLGEEKLRIKTRLFFLETHDMNSTLTTK